jgi:hypothetical protein
LWERDVTRFRLIRYEDFIAQPRCTFQTILTHADEPDATLPLIGDEVLHIRNHHIIAGNANRFQTGHVKLSLDSEWQHRLGWLDTLVTTAITFPLLRKYGYLQSAQAPAVFTAGHSTATQCESSPR